MVELRENEVCILAAIDKLGDKASVEELMAECQISDAAVMRSALILQEGSYAKIHAKLQTQIRLTTEGQKHAEYGLPERRMINAVLELGGKASLQEAAKMAALDQQFAQIALGWIQRKKWATFNSKTGMLQVASTPNEGDDEKLLGILCSQETNLQTLPSSFREAV